MVSNNPFTKLKDICVKITKGSTPTKKDGGFAERGINFIKAESSSYDGVFDDSKFTFVTEEVYEKYKRSQLEKNDILFSMAGAYLGKTGFVEKKHLPANTNQALALIRVDSTLANPKFVLYCLQQRRVVHFVNNSISQSAQPNINLQQIGDLDIDFPDRKVQDSIVNIIDSIVQRSLNNHYTNQTLEQMAQALFKSWFVDFDPVIDNALSAGTNVSDFPEALQQRAELRKQAQQLPDFKALPDDIHSLFPSEFEQTDESSIGIDGLIPKGWKVSSINEFNAINPESWTKKNAPDTVKYIDLANAKNGTILESVDYSFAEAPSRARRVLNKHDIIIGVVRPVNRSFAYVNECGLTGSTGFAVVRSKKENYRAFSYFSLTNDDCIAEFARIADGAAYPAIKPDDVAKAICLYSNEDILETFEKIAGQFLSKKAASEQQLKPLASLRDTLLPKLISGELTIPDSIKTENNVNHQQPKEPLSHHA
jgi:type I restriction enzyme S subunit